jgi:hypothetical protein
VAALSVEGVSKAAIARVEGLSCYTVCHWLELAAAEDRKFNEAKLHGYLPAELQLEEMNTFLGNRKQQTWVFAGSEEPDALIAHIRICGSPGEVTTQGHPAPPRHV